MLSFEEAHQRLADALRRAGSRSPSGDAWLCPVHEVDGKTHAPSLTVKKGDEPGRIVISCAKCKTPKILKLLGLTYSDLAYDSASKAPRKRESAFHYYPDADGREHLRVRRQRLVDGSKRITQQHWNGSSWKSGVGGKERVLYDLPRVLKAARKGHTIHLTEGETDSDALNAWFEENGKKKHFATTHPQGAGKWRSGYAAALAGAAQVVVWADRDAAGYACAAQRFLAVKAAGLSVELRLPVPVHVKADVRDHLDAGLTPAEGTRLSLDELESLRDAPDRVADSSGVLWLSDVQERSLSWLWPGRVPFGKLTILEGDPGLGKSTMWCDIVARVTTGEPFPGEDAERPPQSALVIAAEDDFGDTIIPRLKAAGADVNRVATIPLRRGDDGHLVPLSLPDDLAHIKAMLADNDIKALVIDPVMAFLSEAINSHNDASVRRALTPLVEVLQDTGAACLLIRHLNKSGEMAAMYRGGGSIAFTGAARSGLLVAPHPEDEGVRVLAQVKTNLSRKVPSLTYRVAKRSEDDNVADTFIEWGDEMDADADQLLGKKDGRRDTSVRDAAVMWLRDYLADGPQEAEVVRREGDLAGHSWPTLRRAKVELGADSIRERGSDGKTRAWMWSTGPAVEVLRKRDKKGPAK